MDLTSTKVWIEQREGRRYQVYLDSRGHPTIGIGFNLDRPDAAEVIGALGLDYTQVRSGDQALDDTQLTSLFDSDVETAVAAAQVHVSNFDTLPDVAQTVVVDMVFNLGETKFSRFVNLIDALADRDFARAADEMVDSAWYHQVGQRGLLDVAAMRSADSGPASKN